MKFWALLAGLAAFVLVLAKHTNTIARIVAVIGAFGSVVGNMLAEAYVDGKAVFSQKEISE